MVRSEKTTEGLQWQQRQSEDFKEKAIKEVSSTGEEGCSRGWGETQRQEDGATRELCTKLEQVEARKLILLSTCCVPDPESSSLIYFSQPSEEVGADLQKGNIGLASLSDCSRSCSSEVLSYMNYY